MQVGDFSSDELKNRAQIQSHQTSVYLKIDDNLIDILSLAEKHAIIQSPAPKVADTLRIQVCSMSKVGQKMYAQMAVSFKDVLVKGSRLQTLTLPIAIDGDAEVMSFDECL